MTRLYGNTRISEGFTDILTVSYDLSTNGARVFSSSKARKNPAVENVLITDAVRASASVPTVWEPLQVGSSLCIDGGLFSNNPLLYGLSEAINVYGRDPSECIVFSLGTGFLVDEEDVTETGHKRIHSRGFKFLEKVIRAVVSTDTINTIALTQTFLPNINQFMHMDFPLQWHQFRFLSTKSSFVEQLETIAAGVVEENKDVLKLLTSYLVGDISNESTKNGRWKGKGEILFKCTKIT